MRDPVHVSVEDVETPVLSEERRQEAARIIAKYPTARSAMIPLLYLVQSEVGWVPRQGMREVAELLGLTTAEVEAVATFYTMLKLHPCGRYVISVCTNPSCTLVGARESYDRAKQLLGERAERQTEDGLFTLEEEECLAACDKAPVVAVNYVFYDQVTADRMEQLIGDIREGRVPDAARGAGAPGALKEVSRVLAGLGGSTAVREQPRSEDGAAPTSAPAPEDEPKTGEPQPEGEHLPQEGEGGGPMGEGEAETSSEQENGDG
ncbi:MAG TPA: NAD(P)H-dependent oxidoreductase subunit E [Actinomycetota bacterium]|nr:NAD(P)H-dependent oxidoreductase subunit E [Actinomycetota bacterium]